MTEELRSILVWTAVFLGFELPAHYKLAPWYTLSSTVWHGEQWWWPVALFVLGFMLVLLGHLELHWSVKWLIVTTLAGAFLFASHALEGFLKK